MVDDGCVYAINIEQSSFIAYRCTKRKASSVSGQFLEVFNNCSVIFFAEIKNSERLNLHADLF